MKEKKVEPRIVSGVGVAVGSHASGDAGLAARVEEAMTKAAAAAQAEGITDPAEIKERMLEAREAAMNAPEEEASEEAKEEE